MPKQIVNLEQFLNIADPFIEKEIDNAEKRENVFDPIKQAYVGGWGASRIINLRQQFSEMVRDYYESLQKDSFDGLESEEAATKVLKNFFEEYDELQGERLEEL